MIAQSSSSLYQSDTLTAPSLKKPKEIKKKTLGQGWFDLEPAEMDESLKRDIKIVRMRNTLDPVRFYKNPDKMKAVLHVGTVIEGPTEFKSSRLTNRERKETILEEVMGDEKVKQFSKRKYQEIQADRNNKVKAYKVPKKVPKKSIKHKKIRSLV